MSSPSPSEARAPATWSLVGLLWLVHLAVGWWAWQHGLADAWDAWVGERSPRTRILAGGRYLPLDRAQPWRFATSVWLHVDLAHLAVNSAAVAVLGRLIEPALGGRRLLGLFALGGVASALASHGAGIPQSDGASGALSAWLGAAAVWGWRRGPADDDRALWRGPLTWVAVGNVVLAMAMPRVDATAHLAGTLVGGVWATVDGRRGRGLVGLGIFALFAALAAAGLLWWSGPPPPSGVTHADPGGASWQPVG